MAQRIGGLDGRDGFATLVESEFLARSEKLMTDDLRKSGLDANDVYCEAMPHPPMPMSNPTWVLGAYRIPYWSREGNTLEAMYRDRLFYRPGITERQLKDSRMGKYRGPSGEQAGAAGADARMPYLLPGGQSRVGIICEGEKKAAAVLNRFSTNVLGIGGCWNWTDGSEQRALHEDIVWWAERSGREIIVIVADPDIATRGDIAQGYSGLKRRLQAKFPTLDVRVVALDDKIDDYLKAEPEYGLENLLAENEVTGLEAAMSLRDLAAEYDLVTRATAQGVMSLVKNAYNLHALLNNHPYWKGALKYNEDMGVFELYGQPLMEGHNDHQITTTFNKRLHMPDIGLRMVRDAIRAVALEHKYSPAQEDIKACGVSKEDKYLKYIFGEEASPTDIEIGKALVVGYVKRVLNPGCFWRYMVILVGRQGVGKTGMAKWLAGDENRVAIFEHGELYKGDKDVLIRLMRAKIALFDDIDTFDNRERGSLKRLITQTHTIQRAAYRENEQFYLRSGIMMGTSNHSDIIPDDPTGNTRFLAVELNDLQDFEWLNANRAAIIAEAAGLAAAGWEPKVDWKELDKFTQSTPIHEKVDEFLELLAEGVYNKNPYVLEGRRGRYFKNELFWLFYAGQANYQPKLWESKELMQRLRARGLDAGVDRGNSIDRTRDGKTIKRVWRFPLP